MARILLLGPANVGHIVNVANDLVSCGHDVMLVSLHPPGDKVSSFDARVEIRLVSPGAPIGYFASGGTLKKIFKAFSADCLNVHFASGYGTLARLSGVHPCVLTVWGSDVYEFPYKSRLHRFVLQQNLRYAQLVVSTSHAMERQLRTLGFEGNTKVVPFGVDTSVFKPLERSDRSSLTLTIGTVKTLHYRYGVDRLIKVFAGVFRRNRSLRASGLDLKLVIAGGGPDRRKLVSIARELGVLDHCEFIGEVAHEVVPEVLSRFDIYVALSRKESFGVAILEAMSCARPVLVSDADGPSEIVEDGVSGLISCSQADAVCKLEKLIHDQEYRRDLGREARLKVERLYNRSDCGRQYSEIFLDFDNTNRW